MKASQHGRRYDAKATGEHFGRANFQVPPNELTWHAAATNQGKELAVRAALQARGIDTVLPLLRIWRIRNRQRVMAERPLLPRLVLFGIDKATQSLVDLVPSYVRTIDDELVPVPLSERVVSIPGLERIVRGAGQEWATFRPEDVYDLRFRILRGEFDPTITEETSPIVKWLIDRGELDRRSVLTHKQAKIAGLKFSVAA